MSAYKSTVIQTVHYVEVPYIVARSESEQFKQKVSNWLGLAVNTHVFDFKNVEKIDDSFSDSFQLFKAAAQAKNCSVISVNFRPNILEGIKRKGHEKLFGYVSTFDAVPAAARDTTAEIRNWIIKYLVGASRDAMNIMFNTTVAADENYRESAREFAPEKFHRVAYVTINSANFKADLRLYFDQSVLKALTMLSLGGSSSIKIDDEVVDSTATELLNLIYGGAKSKINDARGYNLPNAIPKLMPTAQAVASRSKDPKCVTIIPFVTPIGAYYLEIDFGA